MQEECEGTRIFLGIPFSDCRIVVKEPVAYQQSIHWIALTGNSFFKMLVSRMTDNRRQNVVFFFFFFVSFLLHLVELSRAVCNPCHLHGSSILILEIG
jgi:hypothetical protein